MAPVIQELQRRAEDIHTIVCVTAQHREMLDQVMEFFGIVPDFDLNIMRENQSLSQVTCEVFRTLEPVLLQEKPDIVLVQGDTTTTMAAALIAYYHKIRVAHIEAGLRTHDPYQPFPEEINRRITDVIADLHFAPTERAREHLLREGISSSRVFVTGNTVIDALVQVARTNLPLDGTLSNIPRNKRLILVTAHRRENFGEPLMNIAQALSDIAGCFHDVHIVYPVHPNPNVQQVIFSSLKGHPQISLIEPLDYLQFVRLMQASFLILTDSGGLQEEAPSLGKPVLVLRDTTERPEGVEAGTAKLIGTKKEAIVTHVSHLLQNKVLYDRMARAVNPYGDGHASKRIVDVLLRETQIDEESPVPAASGDSRPT